MSDNKFRYDVFVSPVGELEYPWLTKADTRFDPDGVYQTRMLLPFEEAQEFIAKLERSREDFFQTLDAGKQKTYNKLPVFEEEVDDEGERTGNVRFKFKLKAKVSPKEGDSFEQRPKLSFVDVDDADKPVYGGSRARIKGQIVPYTNAAGRSVGVTLRLRGVEVHELVTSGGEGAGYWTSFS